MNPHLIPLRAWVATVTLADGFKLTVIARGNNPTDAEESARRQYKARAVRLEREERER